MTAKHRLSTSGSEQPRAADDGGRGAAAGKRGGSGLFLLALGGGCAALLVVVVGAGGVALWLWNRAPGDQQRANVDSAPSTPKAGGANGPDQDKKPTAKGDGGIKPDKPDRATGPVAAVADSEFGPPNDVWNYTIRMPKALVLRFKDKQGGGPGDASFYDWVTPGVGDNEPGQSCNVLRQKIPAEMGPFLALTANRKLKSKPGDPYPFETVVLPEDVVINGIRGARMWQLYTLKERFTVSIEYRFQADDWSIYIRAAGVGKTEAEARRNAEVVDAAICTLRKR
jgi:hypothetical protein